MKKGLLLSMVASTMIFAGGDIVPVAPAAECSDFYGSVNISYRSQQADAGDLFSTTGPRDTSAAGLNRTDFAVAVHIGVEKTLFGGLGFGAEVAGWTDLGWSDGINNVSGRNSSNVESGELSQLFLTASFGNTAIKAGRFALPSNLSPWAWSDRTAGVLDATFNGVLVANTDLADTTVYGVWVDSLSNETTITGIGQAIDTQVQKLAPGYVVRADSDTDTGLFALGFVNKSIANTTITAVGYYVPDAATAVNGFAGSEEIYAGFLTVDTKLGDLKASVRGAYVNGSDAIMTAINTSLGLPGAADATYGIAAQISGNFGAFDASLAASYINDGYLPLNLVTGYGALYTDNEIASEVYIAASDHVAHAVTGVLAKVGVKVGPGKLFAHLGYWNFDTTFATDNDSAVGARLGYSFKVAGISTTIQYRYRNITDNAGVDTERHQIRIDAAYKF